MLFDEYEIYFTSETGFLIFSRVRSTSENIIKILSHEWNKFHIHQQSIEFSVYYIFFAFRACLFQIRNVWERFPAVEFPWTLFKIPGFPGFFHGSPCKKAGKGWKPGRYSRDHGISRLEFSWKSWTLSMYIVK